MFKKLIWIAIPMFAMPAFSQEIAKCTSPKGHAYYPYASLVPENRSGWREDLITGGAVMVRKTGGNNYDLIYSDANRSWVSSVRDGAKIMLARQSKQEFSLILLYPGVTAEIYSFWQANDGQLQYAHLQSKGGRALIPKNSAMIGRCEFIDFSETED